MRNYFFYCVSTSIYCEMRYFSTPVTWSHIR